MWSLADCPYSLTKSKAKEWFKILLRVLEEHGMEALGKEDIMVEMVDGRLRMFIPDGHPDAHLWIEKEDWEYKSTAA